MAVGTSVKIGHDLNLVILLSEAIIVVKNSLWREIMEALAPTLTDELRQSEIFTWVRVDPINETVSLGAKEEPQGENKEIFLRQLRDVKFRCACRRYQLRVERKTDTTIRLASSAGAASDLRRANLLSLNDNEDTISPGDPISVDNRGHTGTLGYMWLLNGRLMGMTCHHVLYPTQQEFGRCITVSLFSGRPIGTASKDFNNPCRDVNQPIATQDFAMFEFTCDVSPSGKLGGNEKRCEACEHCRMACSHYMRTYPKEFGKLEELSPDRDYVVVAGSEMCAVTKLRGFGLVNQRGYYKDPYLLNHQLFFDKCTDNEDSGSMVFDPCTRKIVGMVCAGSGQDYTIASPLVFNEGEAMPDQRRWRYLGMDDYRGARIPSYEIEQ